MTDTTDRSLRAKQKQVAQELILQAAADEIVELGIERLSLQAVADRAGVSKRTLYNYFDSREALLSAIVDWSDELTLAMGGSLAPDGLDTLDQVIPALWRTWDAQGTVYEAVLAIDAATTETGLPEGRQRRRQAFVHAIRDVRPDMQQAEAAELAAVIHALATGAVYQRLVKEDGLPVERGSELISWVINLIGAAIEDTDTPFDTPTTGGKA